MNLLKKDEDEFEGTYRDIRKFNKRMKDYGKYVDNVIWGLNEDE